MLCEMNKRFICYMLDEFGMFLQETSHKVASK